MSFVSAHQPNLKTACLGGVSLHVIQIGYGVLPEFECNELECAEYEDASPYAQNQSTQFNGKLAFLVWIRHWLHWLCGGQGEPFTASKPKTPNRFERRAENCSISFVRYYHHYWKLCPQDLSPAQFLERVCRLSPLGRICIFRMRQSGSVLRRRALLICYDHGWWREPINHMGRVRCGIWHVHLLPDWRLYLGAPMNKINPPGINFMGGTYSPAR